MSKNELEQELLKSLGILAEEDVVMDEDIWQSTNDPLLMLEHLKQGSAYSHRKMRLLLVAYCRYILGKEIVDSAVERVIDIAERYSDRLASMEDILDALLETVDLDVDNTLWLYSTLRSNIELNIPSCYTKCTRKQKATLSDLIRDIFISPFHTMWKHELLFKANYYYQFQRKLDRWLLQNNSLVQNIAESIYKNGSFQDVPIIGDALEEAGCDERAILDHCRNLGNTHVKGCWVIDLLLGKE